MCGIAGLLQWSGPPDAARLDAMLRRIVHRGPDDQGRHSDGPLLFGMRRLSIIDVEGGHQPISNEDGTVTAIFNGEIYNYVELREDLLARGHRFATQSDTEVLVHLYEDLGPDLLPRLNGMFGFAIWDSRRRRLFLARDRLGVKPLYWARAGKDLAFGSELKSVTAARLVDRTLDKRALFDYLVHYYVPGEISPYREIEKLLPGHYLLADESGARVHRWWDLSDHTSPSEMPRDEAVDRVRELFVDSIRLRMRSDVPVGAYLSGGLDSSLVTAVAAQQTDQPFATFNVGFAQSEFDEQPHAREVARHCGTQHHEIRVTPDDALNQLPRLLWHLDEPNGDSAILPTFLVSELAARHVKVVLSGIGADEFFGGYGRYQQQPNKLERLQFLPRALLRALRPLLAGIRYDWGRRLDRMIDPPEPWRDFLEKTHRFDESIARQLSKEQDRACAGRMQELFSRYPGSDYVNGRMYADAHSYLPDQILSLTDRMSMACSLEARTPFLDYRLVELATSLPGRWKAHERDWKMLLKDALGGLLPASISRRPKWGFAAPVGRWMASARLDSLLRLLGESHLARDGHLEAAALKSFVTGPRAVERDGEWIWAIAMLEIWYRVSHERETDSAPSCTLGELAEEG